MEKALIVLSFFFTFLLSPFSSMAQGDEYRIEQAFPVAIRQLTVVEGWTVKLIYIPGEDSTRVTVVTPCPYYFEEGNEPTVCALENDKLHILTNRYMPLGTLLEIRYTKPLEVLMTSGNVDLDTVHMLLRSEGPRCAALSPRNGTLKIKHLVSNGDIGVDCRHERSRVEIGTLRCHQFIVGEEQQQRINVNRIEADTCIVVPHHWWNDINWVGYNGPVLVIGGKMVGGGLVGDAGPYTTTVNMSIDFYARILNASLNRCWWLDAGFGWGFDSYILSYDVLLDENGQIIFNPNHTVNHPISAIASCYLSLPLSIQYRPQNQWVRIFSSHIDLRLTPMLNIWENMLGYRNGKPFTEDVKLFSRFQLRLGLSNTCLSSFRDNIISGGLTWEIFVDLLPTFRPSTEVKGLHQIGIALHF